MNDEQMKRVAEIEGRVEEIDFYAAPWFWEESIGSWFFKDGKWDNETLFYAKSLMCVRASDADEADFRGHSGSIINFMEETDIPVFCSAPKPDTIIDISERGQSHGLAMAGEVASFIAHSREDIPFLLALVKELQAELDKAKKR